MPASTIRRHCSFGIGRTTAFAVTGGAGAVEVVGSVDVGREDAGVAGDDAAGSGADAVSASGDVTTVFDRCCGGSSSLSEQPAVTATSRSVVSIAVVVGYEKPFIGSVTG